MGEDGSLIPESEAKVFKLSVNATTMSGSRGSKSVPLALKLSGFGDAGATTLKCDVCGGVFDTRNKLFTHIRTSGHAAPKGFVMTTDEAAAMEEDRSRKKGGKRR